MRLVCCTLGAALFASCAARLLTAHRIQGTYAPRGDWFAGHSIELRADGTFVRTTWTDALDSELAVSSRRPSIGRYTLDGNAITLRHPSGKSTQYVIRSRLGTMTLWTHEQLAQLLSTGKSPNDLLYLDRPKGR